MKASRPTSTRSTNQATEAWLLEFEDRIGVLAAQYAEALEHEKIEAVEALSSELSQQLGVLSGYLQQRASNPLERDRLRQRLSPMLNKLEGLVRESTVKRDSYQAELELIERARWNGERLADVYQEMTE